MKTATAIYTGQAVAASNTAVTAGTPVRVDLTALTVNDATLEVIATNGATAPAQGEAITVWYGFSTVSYTADATGVARLRPTAKSLRVSLVNEASAIRVFNAGRINLDAQYLYVWLEYPKLSQGITLDAKIVS